MWNQLAAAISAHIYIYIYIYIPIYIYIYIYIHTYTHTYISSVCLRRPSGAQRRSAGCPPVWRMLISALSCYYVCLDLRSLKKGVTLAQRTWLGKGTGHPLPWRMLTSAFRWYQKKRRARTDIAVVYLDIDTAIHDIFASPPWHRIGSRGKENTQRRDKHGGEASRPPMLSFHYNYYNHYYYIIIIISIIVINIVSIIVIIIISSSSKYYNYYYYCMLVAQAPSSSAAPRRRHGWIRWRRSRELCMSL